MDRTKSQTRRAMLVTMAPLILHPCCIQDLVSWETGERVISGVGEASTVWSVCAPRDPDSSVKGRQERNKVPGLRVKKSFETVGQAKPKHIVERCLVSVANQRRVVRD